MSEVIDLEGWRRRHEGGDPRLERAVAELGHALGDQPWRDPPSWVATELLAIHGCMSLDMVDEAAHRTEELAARLGRLVERARRASAR